MTEPIPPHHTPIARAEKLMPALIILLALLLVAGAGGLLVAAWPFATGDTQWRFRTATNVLGAGPQITLPMVLVMVAGVYVGQHSAVRAASIVLLALAGALTVVLPLFALDAIIVRRLQLQSVIGAFTREELRVIATSGLLVVGSLYAGIKGWVASRKDPGGESGVGHGLVVGQPG